MKIYISGPITGNKDYKQQFAAAAERIKRNGAEPVNPAEIVLQDGATYADYMRADIAQLMECGGIYMLAGWEFSNGARLEHSIACALEMDIIYSGYDCRHYWNK